MFKTSSQLRAELETAQSQIASLEAESVEQVAQIESLTSDLATARESLASVGEELTQAQADLEAANAQVADLEASLAEQTAATEQAVESAGAIAAAEVAAAGHPPIDIEAAEATDADAIRKQFASLPAGEERSKFYQKHRGVLGL